TCSTRRRTGCRWWPTSPNRSPPDRRNRLLGGPGEGGSLPADDGKPKARGEPTMTENTITPTETVSAILSGGQALTREQAEALTSKLKGVFSDATLDMIVTAYVGKVWKPLELPSWESWCDENLGVRLRLMKAQQDAVVKRLTEAGASSRAIAAVLGVS